MIKLFKIKINMKITLLNLLIHKPLMFIKNLNNKILFIINQNFQNLRLLKLMLVMNII